MVVGKFRKRNVFKVRIEGLLILWRFSPVRWLEKMSNGWLEFSLFLIEGLEVARVPADVEMIATDVAGGRDLHLPVHHRAAVHVLGPGLVPQV
jgi:hypothetical protein